MHEDKVFRQAEGGTASAAHRLDVVSDGRWWQWICRSTGGILIRYKVYVPEQPIPLKLK